MTPGRRRPERRLAASHASVVVCTYDEGRWGDLAACLDSLERQTLRPLETILVVDHNPALLERARQRFTAVSAMANGRSRGLAGARNSGIEAAHGEIVAFIDDDARAEPRWLEELEGCLVSPGAVGAGGALLPLWQGREPSWFPQEFRWVIGCSYTGLPERLAPVRNPIGANMAVRASVLAEVGGFREGDGDQAPRQLRSRGVVRAGNDVPDDTDLAIRVKQRCPDAVWLYQPAARAHHTVTRERASLGYFLRRCFEEGAGKASLARLVGARSGLASERRYAAAVLPRAVLRELRRLARGDRAAALRAIAIVLGAATAAAAFLGVALRRAAAPRRGSARTAVPGERAAAEGRGRGRPGEPLTVSIVICTRNRPDSVRSTLRSILACRYPPERFEAIVVDNASRADASVDLLEAEFDGPVPVRVLREPEPGLSNARNRGLRGATGEIVVFADDDVAVDRDWLTILTRPFARDERVGATSGLTLPSSLETQVERWTEGFGGRLRAPEARVFDLRDPPPDRPLFPFAVGELGAGRNMAFDRQVLAELGGFDPALGPGTPAHDGDDIEALLRVLLSGRRVVHDPAAIVWHAHPRRYAELEDRVWGYGIGLTACLTKAILDHPRLAPDLLRKLPRGIAFALSPRSAKNAGRQDDFPPALARRELLGMAYGPLAYARSRVDRWRRDKRRAWGMGSASPR